VIETIYLGWDTSPVDSLVQHLSEIHRNGPWIDLSCHTLIVPTARSYRKILVGLVEFSTKHSLRLIPPRLLLPGSVLPVLLRDQKHLDQAGRLVLWVDVLKACEDDLRTDLFPSRTGSQTFNDLLPLAQDLDSLHQEVALGGYSFGDVAEIVSTNHFDDSERWEKLSLLQKLYWERTQEVGYTDLFEQGLAAKHIVHENSFILAGVAGSWRGFSRILL
jgi:hypothetical protein